MSSGLILGFAAGSYRIRISLVGPIPRRSLSPHVTRIQPCPIWGLSPVTRVYSVWHSQMPIFFFYYWTESFGTGAVVLLRKSCGWIIMTDAVTVHANQIHRVLEPIQINKGYKWAINKSAKKDPYTLQQFWWWVFGEIQKIPHHFFEMQQNMYIQYIQSFWAFFRGNAFVVFEDGTNKK